MYKTKSMLTGMGPGSYWDENGIILGWDRDPGRIRHGSHQDGTGIMSGWYRDPHQISR